MKPAFICAVPTLLNALLSHSMTKTGRNWKSIKPFSGAAALMSDTQKRFEELTGGVIVEGYSLLKRRWPCWQIQSGIKKPGSVGIAASRRRGDHRRR